MTRQEHVEEIMRYMLNGHFRAYRFAITKWKRARIAARLAEVRMRTTMEDAWVCGECETANAMKHAGCHGCGAHCDDRCYRVEQRP